MHGAPGNIIEHEKSALDTGKWLANMPLSHDDCVLLGQIGPLQVRLARCHAEVDAAQALRYQVFYNELGAHCTQAQKQLERDVDSFDALCDHLLVIDTSLGETGLKSIVGTYRLLPQDRAHKAGGFYSNSEFELQKLVDRHPSRRFLELGRSCVLPAYRSRRTIELLWQGIWNYCRQRGIDVMTGCASFHGVDVNAHASALSFLHHFCRAEGDWGIRAQPDHFVSMDMMPGDAISAKDALSAMPPLVKGYLRLGARFGEGCVIDHEFNTIDVLVVLPVEAIADRYLTYYGGADPVES